MVRDNPPVEHPVIRTHPLSGKKGLFVNSLFTVAIKGLRKKKVGCYLIFCLSTRCRMNMFISFHGRTTRLRFGTIELLNTNPSTIIGRSIEECRGLRSTAMHLSKKRLRIITQTIRCANLMSASSEPLSLQSLAYIRHCQV
jgi:hypothetical protein